MATPGEPTLAKYFAGLLSSEPGLLTEVESHLTAFLGAVDARSEIVRWSVSRYYEREMGTKLWRRFVSFAPLNSPGRLAAIKLQAQEVYCGWGLADVASHTAHMDSINAELRQAVGQLDPPELAGRVRVIFWR